MFVHLLLVFYLTTESVTNGYVRAWWSTAIALLSTKLLQDYIDSFKEKPCFNQPHIIWETKKDAQMLIEHSCPKGRLFSNIKIKYVSILGSWTDICVQFSVSLAERQVWNIVTCVSVTVMYFSDASQVKQTGVNSLPEIKHHDLGLVSSNWATSLYFWYVCVWVCVHENVCNCICLCI